MDIPAKKAREFDSVVSFAESLELHGPGHFFTATDSATGTESSINSIYEEESESDEELDQDIYNRPSVREFAENIRKRTKVRSGSILKRGMIMMVDLATKQQGSINISQLGQFGRRIRPKIAKFVSQQSSAPKFFPDLSQEKESNGLPVMDDTPENMSRARQLGNFDLGYRYWIDILTTSQEDMEVIQDAFNIHPLTVEDIMTQSREKIEEFPTYLFVVFNERQKKKNSSKFNKYRDVNLNILLFPGIIISIHRYPVVSLAQVIYFARYGDLPEDALVDWILYKFLDMITDEFVLMVDAIYREIDHLDSLVTSLDPIDKEAILKRMGSARQQLTHLRGSLLSKREILTILCSPVKMTLFVDHSTKVYLRDVLDHIVMMIQKLDMTNEMLTTTSSTYLTMISIEMAATDSSRNNVTKCFGAVATIGLPLTVITGLWGMNVHVPGQLDDRPEDWIWFYLVILLFFLWIVIAVLFFRCKKWC